MPPGSGRWRYSVKHTTGRSLGECMYVCGCSVCEYQWSVFAKASCAGSSQSSAVSFSSHYLHPIPGSLFICQTPVH
jgi:hypothetical protein